MSTITHTTNITAFPTDQGLDLVLKHSIERNAPSKRVTLPWNKLKGTIDCFEIAVTFFDNNNAALGVLLNDTFFRVYEQEAGHFFGYAMPKPKQAISLAEARRLAAA